MRAVWAVYKRELALYFRSPIAYGVALALFLFLGLLFTSNVSAGNGQAPATFLNIAPELLSFLTFLVAPLLTMRLLSEEAREGTLEVLMTLPMRELQFVLGKFLAVWSYYTLLLVVMLIYPILLSTVGILDIGQLVGSYLGAWLYGGAMLAVCLIWSALFEDQIVAAFLGAASVLVLFLAESAAIWASNQGILSGAADFIREFSLSAHYQSTLAQGVLRAEDILYFVLMIIAAIFITVRIVEIRRWRA